VWVAVADCVGVPADQIFIITAEGKNMPIYLDISDFSGKDFERPPRRSPRRGD
jgi:hypothetical protein